MVVLISASTTGQERQDNNRGEEDAATATTDSLATQLDNAAELLRDITRKLRVESPVLTKRIDSLIRVIRDARGLSPGAIASDSMLIAISEAISRLPENRADSTTLLAIRNQLDAHLKVLKAYRELLDKSPDAAETKLNLWLGCLWIVGSILFYMAVKHILTHSQDRYKTLMKILRLLQYIAPIIGAGGALWTIDKINFAPTIQPVVWHVSTGLDGEPIVPIDTVLYVKLDALTTKVDSILNTQSGKIDKSLHGKLDSILRVDPNMPDTSLHRKVDSLFDHQFTSVDPAVREMIREALDDIENGGHPRNYGGTDIEQLPTVGNFPTSVYQIKPDNCPKERAPTTSGPVYSSYCELADSLRARIVRDKLKLVTLVLIGNADMRPVRGAPNKKALTNSGLAQRRAESVKRNLLNESLGLDADQIVTLNSAVTARDGKSPWHGGRYPRAESLMAKERRVQALAVWKKPGVAGQSLSGGSAL